VNGKTVQEETLSLIGVKFTTFSKKKKTGVLYNARKLVTTMMIENHYSWEEREAGESCCFISEVRNRGYKTVIRQDKPPITGIKSNLESLSSSIKLALE
jgi:hypothetical protein